MCPRDDYKDGFRFWIHVMSDKKKRIRHETPHFLIAFTTFFPDVYGDIHCHYSFFPLQIQIDIVSFWTSLTCRPIHTLQDVLSYYNFTGGIFCTSLFPFDNCEVWFSLLVFNYFLSFYGLFRFLLLEVVHNFFT